MLLKTELKEVNCMWPRATLLVSNSLIAQQRLKKGKNIIDRKINKENEKTN